MFIGGPRQVGKTTLAKAVLSDHFPSGRVLNWDLDEDRRDILKKRWKSDDQLLVYADRLNPPRATQIVAHLKKPFDQGRIRVSDPLSYFQPDIFDGPVKS